MLGRKVIINHFQVSEYTSELFGVEYLYSQSGYTLSPKEEELDKEIDEGFGDISVEDTAAMPSLLASESDVTIAPPDDPDSDGDDDQEVEETNEEEKVQL